MYYTCTICSKAYGRYTGGLSGSMEYPAFSLLTLSDLTLSDWNESRRIELQSHEGWLSKEIAARDLAMILDNGDALHRQFIFTHSAFDNQDCEKKYHICLRHEKSNHVTETSSRQVAMRSLAVVNLGTTLFGTRETANFYG